jgi:hypothetical protein
MTDFNSRLDEAVSKAKSLGRSDAVNIGNGNMTFGPFGEEDEAKAKAILRQAESEGFDAKLHTTRKNAFGEPLVQYTVAVGRKKKR